MEELEHLLKKDEEILWKQCKNIDYYSDIMEDFRLWLFFPLIIVPGCIVLFVYFIISNFNLIPLILIIMFLLTLIVPSIVLIKTSKEIKRGKKLVSKNELKNYKCCSVITNKRFIHKDFPNFDKKYVSKLPIIISEQIEDIIVINLEDIKMIGTISTDYSYYSLLIFCKIVDFNKLVSLSLKLTSEELIEALKTLHNLLHFKQEEHHIIGGIIYLCTKQTIPQKYSNLFKSEKNNMKFLSNVLKINKK